MDLGYICRITPPPFKKKADCLLLRNMIWFVQQMKRQEEVERLKAAMDEAHEKAMREKYSRKMQHLEQGGHDTTQLKAHLAGNYRGVY